MRVVFAGPATLGVVHRASRLPAADDLASAGTGSVGLSDLLTDLVGEQRGRVRWLS